LRNTFLILLVVVLLGACSPKVTTPIVFGEQTNTPFPPETSVSISTSTNQITIQSTPKATITPNSRFTQQCLTIDNREVTLNEITSGTILFSWSIPNSSTLDDRRSLLYDIQTGNEYSLPSPSSNNSLEYFAVSPNRNLLARLEVTLIEQNHQFIGAMKAVLWLFDARANVVAKMNLKQPDLLSLAWLDDERLIIVTAKYGSLLLVNPFTGEQRVVDDKLPNLYPYKPYWERQIPWNPVVYSSDLEWVIYPSQYIDSHNGAHSESVLYDVTTKQTLWTDDAGIVSVWSPDGQVFAFTLVGKDERQLYLFSRSKQLKTVLDNNPPHEVDAFIGFKWSPDGNLMAFGNAGKLMIYDRQKDWVFDTCVPVDRMFAEPWSSDSQQLVVYSSDSPASKALVDWQAKIIYKNIKGLSRNMEPYTDSTYEWMNAIP
jgi:hypothetical protein